jgi:hypothetical protein
VIVSGRLLANDAAPAKPSSLSLNGARKNLRGQNDMRRF